MLEKTIRSRKGTNSLTPKAGELKLLHCMVVCRSNLSIITENVLSVLNKKLLRSKRAHCMAKQQKQEVIQSKQLLHKIIDRTERKTEGQVQKSKPNHFSTFMYWDKSRSAEQLKKNISQVAVTSKDKQTLTRSGGSWSWCALHKGGYRLTWKCQQGLVKAAQYPKPIKVHNRRQTSLISAQGNLWPCNPL